MSFYSGITRGVQPPQPLVPMTISQSSLYFFELLERELGLDPTASSLFRAALEKELPKAALEKELPKSVSVDTYWNF